VKIGEISAAGDKNGDYRTLSVVSLYKNQKKRINEMFSCNCVQKEKTKYVLLLLILCWRKRRKAKAGQL
jgi:hypothetical protein